MNGLLDVELGTIYVPISYGLNDRLQHVGNVSHSSMRSRNNVFTLDQLHNLYCSGGQGHGGLHRLLTTLHSAWLPNLRKLFNECEQLIVANQDQRFRSIVLVVCCKRLFFPIRTGTDSTAKPLRRFIKVFFYNKGDRYVCKCM